MATLNPHRHQDMVGRHSDQRQVTRTRLWAVPLGRALYSLIFILSAPNHFTSGSIAYAESAGLPFPGILVPASGIIMLAGGLSVLFGYRSRFGAFLIALFLVPAMLVFHDFWTLSDPMEIQNQMAHFMKNLSLLGGAILIMFYGSGPHSFDHHHHHN